MLELNPKRCTHSLLNSNKQHILFIKVFLQKITISSKKINSSDVYVVMH